VIIDLIAKSADFTDFYPRWFVDAPSDILKQRIIKRHLTAGIETSLEAATKRVENNDIPNGEYIRARLIEPEVIVMNV